MQDAHAQTYYAYKIALPDAPEGYYPVGTREEMIAIYNSLVNIARAVDARSGVASHLKASQAAVISDILNEGVEVFRLDKDVEPLRPSLDGDAVSREFKNFFGHAMQSDQFCIPTGSVRKKIGSLADKFKPALMSGQDAFNRVRKGQGVEPMQIVLAATSAFSGVAEIRAEYSNALNTLIGKFGASADKEFLKNSQGLFVHQDWLADPQNASRLYKISPARERQQQASPAAGPA